MAASPIDTYRREIERELQAGNATEHTHRPALKALIESLAPEVTATNEPRRVECGAPGFVISCKAAHGLSDDLLSIVKDDLERPEAVLKN